MTPLDLQPKHLRLLIEVLNQILPEAEVWAYGSRVNHTAHDASDLDLVVRNPNRLDAPQKNLRRLRDALTESNLPILVEVLDWARISEEFRREIHRQPVVALSSGHAATKGSPRTEGNTKREERISP